MTAPTIAVGIDFSNESETAGTEARRVARHLGGELMLVHVSAPVDVPGPKSMAFAVGERAMEALRQYRSQTMARDRLRLSELRQRMNGEIHVVQALIEGDPGSGLCVAARETGSELLVVGTHGYTGLDWFLLGSVAQRVIRMAEVDVLVARNSRTSCDGYRRILVATDFSPSSGRALDRAIQLAAPDAEIEVVHFYHYAPYAELGEVVCGAVGADPNEALMDELEAAGQSFIDERCPSGGPTVRFYAGAEAPVTGIIQWLERQSFDLVALGSHGRRGFRRFLLGSVAEAVAKRAPCSTLIARGQSEEVQP